MADPMEVAVDPPPQPPPATSDVHSGLSISPIDANFVSQDLVANDGVPGGFEEGNDSFAFEDLDFDISFDDVCLPFSDDLEDFLNPTQVLQSEMQEVYNSDFHLIGTNCDQFTRAVFKSSPELRHHSGEGDYSSNGSGVLTSESPEIEANQISGYLNVPSPESNGSNHGISANCGDDVKELSCPSPESQGSRNFVSSVSKDSNNCMSKSVSSFSPNSNNSSIKAGVVHEKIKLEDSANKNRVNSSLLKRKKENEDSTMTNNVESRINKYMKSNSNIEYNDTSDNNCGLSEEEGKKKARLMRNRESAQLSRQRKKHYVEELEDKVKNMQSTIQDLNAKISYFMAENATLRQHVGGGAGVVPPPIAPPPPGIYPHPAMMYPWMPCVPPYMMKGSQVPLVPIPKLKPQQPTQSSKVSKKVECNKKEGPKTKKVAGVSFLGLLFFIMLFGGLVPMVNVRYGGVREAFTGGESYVGGGFSEKHHGRVLMVNGTEYGGKREFSGNSSVHCGHTSGEESSVDECSRLGNGSEPLTASLYVPRNDKLVKIDGNLIIHSIMASEKAMASHGKEVGETGLAIPGDLSPYIHVADVGKNGARHLPLRTLGSDSANNNNLKSTATDGKLQQWFREGLAGPMLSSGMCTEVFQFDVSSAIVPATTTTTTNISEKQNQNSARLIKGWNRRILNGVPVPVPLPEPSHNISKEHAPRNSQKENLNGNNNNASTMVVSVLVDPREAGDADIDSVIGTKALSRIFVVVLIDSVKYVTYSCMLPFMGSAPVVSA